MTRLLLELDGILELRLLEVTWLLLEDVIEDVLERVWLVELFKAELEDELDEVGAVLVPRLVGVMKLLVEDDVEEVVDDEVERVLENEVEEVSEDEVEGVVNKVRLVESTGVELEDELALANTVLVPRLFEEAEVRLLRRDGVEEVIERLVELPALELDELEGTQLELDVLELELVVVVY